MDLLEYSIEWCKGEIFEAKLILTFGIGVMVAGLLFYTLGGTRSAKAMLLPLLVVGLIFSAIGGGMLYSNPKRIIEFEQAFQEDPAAFAQAENLRTDEFISWYPKTRIIMAVLGIIGILTFMFWSAPLGRAIGFSLILIALGTFVVDHFSEERAGKYKAHILEAVA